MFIVIIRNYLGHKTEFGPFSEQRAVALATKRLAADPFNRAEVVRPGHEARRLAWLYGPLVRG